MKNLFYSYYKKYRNIVFYGAVGLLALTVEFTSFYSLITYLQANIALANAAAMAFGLLVSFSFNTIYTFNKKDRIAQRFFRFSFVTFIGYFINTGLVMFGVEALSMSALIAKVFALPFFFLFQYNFNRIFTFKQFAEEEIDIEPASD